MRSGHREDVAEAGRAGCVQSLVRALNLLDELAGQGAGMTLTEIARRAQLPRSTAHRLLTTMESMRYVAFDPATAHWGVGLRAAAFGGVSIGAHETARYARPVLQSLQTAVSATASFSLVEGETLRRLSQVRELQDRAYCARPGDTLPLHASAAGKATLAHWPQAQLETYLARTALERRTVATITDPRRLRAELEQVRRCGYAVDDGEARDGLRCVAVAVLDRDGEARGALSVSSAAARAPDRRLEFLAAAVQASARRLAEGFRLSIAA